jgi:hypothetical protein
MTMLRLIVELCGGVLIVILPVIRPGRLVVAGTIVNGEPKAQFATVPLGSALLMAAKTPSAVVLFVALVVILRTSRLTMPAAAAWLACGVLRASFIGGEPSCESQLGDDGSCVPGGVGTVTGGAGGTMGISDQRAINSVLRSKT